MHLHEPYLEREVELGTRGRPGLDGLPTHCGFRLAELGVVVEGKAHEPFGPVVSWNDGPGKQDRLENLCEQLGLDPSQVGGELF